MNKIWALLVASIAGLTITTHTAAASDLFTANETSLDIFGYRASRDKGGADTTTWTINVFRFGFRFKFQ